jgi:Uma2 family endonuclease
LAPKSYVESHPAPEDARLLIEVADSFLLFDKMVKVPLYASFAIPEVWVVDLTANSVDIYRNPTPQGYESQISAQRGDQIAPMSLPSLSLAVADILG